MRNFTAYFFLNLPLPCSIEHHEKLKLTMASDLNGSITNPKPSKMFFKVPLPLEVIVIDWRSNR